MTTLEFITGHVIYNLAYTYKFQLKTTYNPVFSRVAYIFATLTCQQVEISDIRLTDHISSSDWNFWSFFIVLGFRKLTTYFLTTKLDIPQPN